MPRPPRSAGLYIPAVRSSGPQPLARFNLGHAKKVNSDSLDSLSEHRPRSRAFLAFATFLRSLGNRGQGRKRRYCVEGVIRRSSRRPDRRNCATTKYIEQSLLVVDTEKSGTC